MKCPVCKKHTGYHYWPEVEPETMVRQERDRAERRQKKEDEAARRKQEQPALFDF